MKDIKGFEGLYAVTKDGKVWSHRSNRFLVTPLSSGYKNIVLHNGSNRRSVRVHRLVAETYIPRIEGKSFINHINANKLDNRVENLEWCTNEENIKAAWAMGLCKPPKPRIGADNNYFKIDHHQIEQARTEFRNGERLYVLAKRYGVAYTYLSQLISGKRVKKKEGELSPS